MEREEGTGGGGSATGVSPSPAKPPASPGGGEGAEEGEMGGGMMLWGRVMAAGVGKAMPGLGEGCAGAEDAFCHPPFSEVPGTALVGGITRIKAPQRFLLVLGDSGGLVTAPPPQTAPFPLLHQV